MRFPRNFILKSGLTGAYSDQVYSPFESLFVLLYTNANPLRSPMKKAVLTFALCVGFAVAGLAQADINWRNTPTTLITTNSIPGGPATGPIIGVGSYRFALYAAPEPVSGVSGAVFNDANWIFTGNYGTSSGTGGGPNAGRFTTANALDPLPGLAVGSTAHFIVLGWSANIGTTVADVANWYNSGFTVNPFTFGWIGQSAIGTLQVGGSTTPVPPTPLFGSGPGQIGGFNLGIVPEPSTFALLGAGMATFVFRKARRKSIQ
jgi:PEP-CTERM motif-containing protein